MIGSKRRQMPIATGSPQRRGPHGARNISRRLPSLPCACASKRALPACTHRHTHTRQTRLRGEAHILKISAPMSTAGRGSKGRGGLRLRAAAPPSLRLPVGSRSAGAPLLTERRPLHQASCQCAPPPHRPPLRGRASARRTARGARRGVSPRPPPCRPRWGRPPAEGLCRA